MRFCPKCQVETDRCAHGNCKPCAKAWSLAWRAANPEKQKARDAAYRAANSEKVKASAAVRSAVNAVKLRQTTAAWYAANTEKSKQAIAAWNRSNPEATRIHKQNRRARKMATGGKLSQGLALKLFALQKGMCPCCKQPLGVSYHLDHIQPLALGGENADENMQLLRATCNMHKHTKHPIDYMQSKGYLL